MKEERYAIMLYHYATWFNKIGDFSNSERLINNMSIEWDDEKFQKVDIEGKKYWLITQTEGFGDGMLSDFIQSFKSFLGTDGISVDVVEALKTQEYEKLKDLNFDNKSTDDFESFSDGTIVWKK